MHLWFSRAPRLATYLFLVRSSPDARARFGWLHYSHTPYVRALVVGPVLVAACTLWCR